MGTGFLLLGMGILSLVIAAPQVNPVVAPLEDPLAASQAEPLTDPKEHTPADPQANPLTYPLSGPLVFPQDDTLAIPQVDLSDAPQSEPLVPPMAESPQDEPMVGDILLETPPSNVVSESINGLAIKLLQEYSSVKQNFALSPLGYSVVLAMIAEGARGQTRDQLGTVLRLPEDLLAVRDNYKAILQDMRSDSTVKHPPEFGTSIVTYKSNKINDTYKEIIEENYLTVVRYLKDDEEGDEDEKFEEENGDFEKERVGGENWKNVYNEKSRSKTDILDKMPKQQTSTLRESYEDERKDESSDTLYNGPYELMGALEQLGKNSKLLIENVLQFYSTWKTPFTVVKDEEKRSFYKFGSEKNKVAMMQAQGSFAFGAVPELDATVLELPYAGEKYSMLVILPNQRDGLDKLMSDMTGFSLNKVYKYLVERPVEVLLPKFGVQTMINPEKMLQKLGICDLFTDEADLSGISQYKLKIAALLQTVMILVDEGAFNSHTIGTTFVNGVTKRSSVESFVADHPFLFFIRDRKKDMTLAAGKVIDPPFGDFRP